MPTSAGSRQEEIEGAPSRPSTQRRQGAVSLAAAVLTALVVCPGPVLAQAGPREGGAWNGTRVLSLAARARALRWSTVEDPDLHSYQADARGYVYFFIDRPDSEERTLVKADQIALQVFWQAPNLTKQRIVGLRDEKVLPTNIRYHLDHLTVVQDDFSDHIRMGDGDEVAEVLHPLGPSSEDVYDFMLADSLTLRYGGEAEEVRVYEIRVRPKDFDAPGFIGSVFVDRANAAIVRMTFTFTPSSYVDPYLDYIRISLDNSLWMGRYWLPYRQEAEIRREMPALDFLAGSIIRGRFEIAGYEFNEEQPLALFTGGRVTTVSERQREAFPFDSGLFDQLDDVGLAPTPTMEEIRAQALEMAGRRYLTGLSPWRLHLSSVSDAIRYNRAEGLFLGGGAQFRPGNDGLVRASVGRAFGAHHTAVDVSTTSERGDLVPTLDVSWNALRDVGTTQAAAPTLGSVSAAFGSEDYLDPFFARSMSLSLTSRRRPDGLRLRLRFERHSSAASVLTASAGSSRRPVRGIDEGILGAAEIQVPFTLPGGGEARLRGLVGRFETDGYRSLEASGRWASEGEPGGWSVALQAQAGAASRGVPAQSLYLLGGRGSLPGYAFRGFVGTRYGLLRAEASRALFHPWMGVRAFASLGATSLPSGTSPAGWNAHDSDGLRPSVGLGLSFGWDVLRLDLGRGLRGGTWDLTFALDPRFHVWL